MKNRGFNIEGMSCQHCIMAVERELAKFDLEKSEVELGRAEITFDETKINEDELIETINASGYKVVSGN